MGRLGRAAAVLSGAGAVAAASIIVGRRARAARGRRLRPEGTGGARAQPGPVSVGHRTGRSVEVARVGARAGANYARFTVRSTLASADRREGLRREFELETAEQVAEALGNMKGALMKLGQMASYLDQGLPEPVRAALAQLQTDAPPMSASLVGEMIAAELGGEPDAVFASFDPAPLAAASIGQVHRAVTRDGRAVAVKVQYPGVDAAIASDLDNADLLFGGLGMVFSGMDPKPIVAELRDRLAEELDYRNEAANQTRFADYYAGHPTISVPRVLTELSTARVLTSELAVGATWAELLTWPQAERDLAAETMYRFAFGGIYRIGAFNGDPHPGNYLFAPGGRVTFLDFGLCKVFEPDEVKAFEELVTAMVLERDLARFRAVMDRLGFLTRADAFSDQEIGAYMSHFFDFVLTDERLTMTPDYASEMVRRYFDLSGPFAPLLRSLNLPGWMVIVQRINLGLFALLGELRATANWRRIAEELWPFVSGPPSTPMGAEIAAWYGSRP